MTEPKEEDEVLAVVGEQASLYLESKEIVQGTVKVDFEVMKSDDQSIIRDFWEEDLLAKIVSGGPPYRSRISWTVNLNGSKTMPENSEVVFFRVNLPGHSEIKSQNHLLIPGFSIIKDERIQRIMLHEFAVQETNDDGSPGKVTFDSAPLKKVLDDLAPEQRKLLAETKAGSDGHRLVCFAILQPQNSLLMHADTCQEDNPRSIKPNATLTIFDCRGPGEEVRLICHTNYFVLNMNNNATRRLILNPIGGKESNLWLQRSNPMPPIFKIGAFMNSGTHGVLYNRIFNSDGTDIMPGNTLHGKINTDGCWMLFRNFNWPKSVEDEFDHIFIYHYRFKRTSPKKVNLFLAALGYDHSGNAEMCSSYDKFWCFDRNCAYNWLFRDIVGIKYISQQRIVGQLVEDYKPICYVHEENLHGLEFRNTLEYAKIDDFVKNNGDDAQNYVFYDTEARKKQQPSFVPDDKLWIKNALNFSTAKGFVPPATPKNNLKKEDVDRLTWADLYIYRADSLTVGNDFPRFYLNENKPGNALHISLVLYYEESLQPIANSNYRLYLDSGDIEGMTDNEGFMEHGEVEAGDYLLEIAGGTTLVPAVPLTVDGLGWMVLGSK